MTARSETLPRLALAVPAGRLGRVELELGAVLAVLALAGVVFNPALGTPGALLFLAAGAGLVLLRPGRVFAMAVRNWPAMLMAVFCILSFTWSREPALSLRFGVQLAATAVIALAICERLPPRAFCLSLAALLGISMAASMLGGGTSGETAAWIGVYGSKNAFAGAAATFAIFAFGLALARGRALFRAGWLAAGVVGCGLVVLAQSVGALVLLAVTIGATLFVLGVARMGPAARVALLAGGVLAAAFVALLASAHVQAISDTVLETTGKDLTLTGRTELWAVARDLIADRPFLGVGYQAFWVQGNADAEALWFMFGIEGRGGFNFHNMYLSNAVEIGLLGVTLQALVLFGAGLLTLRWTLLTGRVVPAIFFGKTLMVVFGSLIEVPLFFQFGLNTFLVFAAFAYARDAVGRAS